MRLASGARSERVDDANVLDKLPKRLHRHAKVKLHEIIGAESRKAAEEAIARFEADYGAKYPKAVASLQRDEVERLTLFDFPAEPWVHPRTWNVIASPLPVARYRVIPSKLATRNWSRLPGSHRTGRTRWMIPGMSSAMV